MGVRGVGRRLLKAAAWSLATAAAVALCWVGVGRVLWSTASAPPRATPLATPAAGGPGWSGPDGRGPAPSATSSSAASSTRRPPSGSPDGSPAVASRTVRGGRVTFDVAGRSAALVSATPHPGWRMRIAEGRRWIRVVFTSGDRVTAVLCTWQDGGPPRLLTYPG